MKKKVLILTDVDFWAMGAGHRMRILNLVKYLQKQVELTVFYIAPPPETNNFEFFNNLNCRIVFANMQPFSEEKYASELSNLTNCEYFDCVIVEYIHNTYFLKYVNFNNAKIILDAHDIISDRTEEFKKFNCSGAIYEMTEEFERQVFDIYDYIIVLCEKDYQRVNSLLGTPKALICPHPSDFKYRKTKTIVRDICFVASEYYPNVDAITFFIDNCWPEIIKNFNVNLKIFGNVCNAVTIPAGQNIHPKGFSKYIAEVYDSADIVINPIRFGAGVKIKNIEALSNSRPLLTTTHGARGLEKGAGDSFLIADKPEEIIECLSYLIKTPEARVELSKKAFTFAKQHFSPAQCFKPLMEVL